MGTVIETNELKKSYGKHEAVKGLNLAVQDGSVCAFLGPEWRGQEFDDQDAPWHDPSNVGHWQHLRPQD